MSSSVFSVRARQKEALEKMFDFNQSSAEFNKASKQSAIVSGEGWKVLVYDTFCRDIISVLFHVADLRKHSITLHLNIEAERQIVPDTPAIYFVLPTQENIERICKDAARGMYENIHLNFASSVPRHLLEKLASGVVESDSVASITKVHDQYLQFVCPEPALFSLHQPASYAALSDPALADAQVEALVDGIVASLFAVLATLNVVPVIRAPRGGAAEMAAARLHKRLQDHLLSRNNLFAQSSSSTFQRPLLVLLDRSFDLTVALHHTWTYRPLLHDVLDMRLNKVAVPDKDGGKGKAYDLVESDPFWAANAASPFPTVAEEVDKALSQYKASMEKISRETGLEEGADITGSTKGLVSAVESLPALTERKRVIDMHTTIASGLLGHIKNRELDAYHHLEETLIANAGGGAHEKSQMLALLGDAEKGLAGDKLRLALIYILSAENVSDADSAAIEQALVAAGAELHAVSYVKALKRLRAFGNAPSSSGAPSAARGMFSGLAGKMGTASKLAMGQIKSWVAGGRELAITRVVHSLAESKPGELDDYLYLDPKLLGDTTAPQGRSFRDAVVFVIGGGNYVEYEHLQEYAKSPKHAVPKNIIYGSTEIVSPDDFVKQLSSLGQKTGSA